MLSNVRNKTKRKKVPYFRNRE